MLPTNGGVAVAVVGLALVGALGDLDCASPVEARSRIALLRLAEIEYAEDVHREAHWEDLGRCPRGRLDTSCRAATSRRFEALWETRRAEIDAKYRGMLEDYETRCRATVSLLPGRAPARGSAADRP